MSRYTRAEFNAAGLQPNEECDGTPFNEYPGAPETENSYWFPCQYHEGYIDGFESLQPRYQRVMRNRKNYFKKLKERTIQCNDLEERINLALYALKDMADDRREYSFVDIVNILEGNGK